jgi:ABC-type lipoprotein release transport system permease subunit
MEPADVAAVFGLVLLMAALAAFVAVRRLGRVDPLSLFE